MDVDALAADVDTGWGRRLFVVTTVALLLPLAMMAVRVLLHDWSNPGGDLALIELRTSDVGAHTPLLGSYGRFGFSQPGPLWFFVLALPYRLLGSRYAGLQVGVLLVNAAAVVTMLVIARRRAGVVGMMIVAALLALVLRGMGSLWLADPWEPHGLTLLCAALLFLAWDAALGGRAALVSAAVVAVLLAEAQAGLAIFAGTMLAIAITATAVRARRGPKGSDVRRASTRVLLITVGVLAFAAIPPVLAVVRGEDGNLRDLVHSMRHPPASTLGLPDAWRAVVAELGQHAPWIRGDQSIAPLTTFVDTGHGSAVPIGLVAFVALGVVAVRARNRAAPLFVTVGAGVAAAVLSLARLLGPLFFWIPEWTRALGFGAAVAIAFGAFEWLGASTRRRATPVVIAVLSAATVLVSVTCLVDAIRAEPLDDPSLAAVHRLAAAALPEAREGTSLVTATEDPSQLLGSDLGSATLVLDLERAGADVVVDSTLADHFGDHRAQPGRAVRELRLLTDRDPVPEGFRVLATVDPLPPEQRDARNELLARYPELGPDSNTEDRLRLIQADPELRAAAEQLAALPAQPVLRLVTRPLPAA